MAEGIDELLLMLSRGSLVERAQAEGQLAQYVSSVVIKAIVDKLLQDDEPKRRSLITPLVKGLQSRSIMQRELSMNELLQIGHFCIPYLDETLLQLHSSSLIKKVWEEIIALDHAPNELQNRSSENVSRDVLPPDLTDEI